MTLSKKNRSAILTAIAAAIGYGSWAAYANWEYGMHAGIMAGLVQASYAFFSTFSITYVARKIYIKYNCGIKGILTGFAMSFLVMLAIPLAVQNLVGTQNISKTILPGLIWGSIYLLGFLISLEKTQVKNRTSSKK